MEENEKILQDLEKPFEEKLAEEKDRVRASFHGGHRPTMPAIEESTKEEDLESMMPEIPVIGEENQKPTPSRAAREGPQEQNSEEQKVEEQIEESESPSPSKGLLVPQRRRRATTSRNDDSSPHLVQLHEDPMLSGKVYYSLANGSIHMGKRKGNPTPQIILGDINIKTNHANISLLPNGLLEFKVCDKEAGTITLLNGKPLGSRKKKILAHLDRIALPGGIIFVYKNPLIKRAVAQKVKEREEENQGMDISL